MTSTTLKNTLFYGCLMLFLSGSSCLNDIIDLENNRANELASDLAGLNPIASLITQIDIPEDNTPQGPEDEDDAGSASGHGQPKESKHCKHQKANSTTEQPLSLLHMTFDNMCKQSVEKNVKILPVYVVGWELKECSDINEIPFKRFQMEKYQNRKPKFDIPGMCLPLKGKEMTLMMIDPDYPSKKNHRCRSWLQWLVINIPKGNVSKGDQIVEYNPPSPLYRSGLHRYYFLLYEQERHINQVDDSENNFAVRCRFNVRHFAEDNALLGPVAMNMFMTQKGRNS